MIIEIALGIVLAVLILAFLPQILGIGVLLIGLAVVLAIAGTAVYFAFTEPMVSGIIVGVAALIGGAAYWDAKHGYKKPPPLTLPVSPRLAQDDAERREIADRSSDDRNTTFSAWRVSDDVFGLLHIFGIVSLFGFGAVLISIALATPEALFSLPGVLAIASFVMLAILVIKKLRARVAAWLVSLLPEKVRKFLNIGHRAEQSLVEIPNRVASTTATFRDD